MIRNVTTTLILIWILLTGICAAQENLALKAHPEVSKFSRSAELAIDGKFAPDGATWRSALAIASADSDARLILDLGNPTEIAFIVLQADGNDTYIVDFSLDKSQWMPVWHAAPNLDQIGLQRRALELDSPQRARYVRVRAGQNDGSISISEVQLFSQRPTDWSTLSDTGQSQAPWQWLHALDSAGISRIKELVAVLGLIILVANILLRAVGRSDFLIRSRSVALAGLAIFAAALWCNLFQFHFNSRVHLHEFYHYFLGAKYSPELGYSRLYRCTIAADRETDLKRYAKNRLVRNLDDNSVVNSDSIESQRDCKNFFSAERWSEFKADLKWFRDTASRETYTRMQLDHGYNATPVWGVLGYFLSNIAPASEHSLFMLSLLDPLMLLLCFAIGMLAFGFEATCVAVIFFGTNFIANYSWTGGAFLRLDWLVYSMLGICLLKLKHPLKAVALLTYAGLLRIFPFAFLAFAFLHIVSLAIAARSLTPLRESYKLLVVAVLSAVFWIGVSALPTRSLSVWSEFSANTFKHFSTRSTNMLGLEPLLVARADNSTQVLEDPLLPDPFSEWKSSLHQTSKQLAPTFIAIVSLYLFLLLRRICILEQWQSAVLGLTVLPMIHLANYDYYFLIFLAWLGWPNQLMLLALTWLSWLAPILCQGLDQTYIFASALSTAAIALAPWLTSKQ